MKNSEILKQIGNKVRIARLNKGLTQETLSEKCGVSTKYISVIECGATTGSIPLLIDICNALDISADYIFSDLIKNSNHSVDVLSLKTSATYLKLKPENKKFVEDTIAHLYSMQNKR